MIGSLRTPGYRTVLEHHGYAVVPTGELTFNVYSCTQHLTLVATFEVYDDHVFRLGTIIDGPPDCLSWIEFSTELMELASTGKTVHK
jgi:hypothetical protein